MDVYGRIFGRSVSMYMEVYGSIWKYMAVYGSIWKDIGV
jgi:hypothetical protein